MSVLVDEQTRLLVQGLTGREGSFHAGRNRRYGTNVVAGVTPGKGGSEVDGVPVFDTVADAVAATGANASMVFVPARAAADAILEAHDSQVSLIVVITENIPAMDMARVAAYVRSRGSATTVIGPNCPGVISPGKANVGIIPAEICAPGPIALVSRSGTLTYQIINELTQSGIGQSTCVGIGGDAIPGSDFIDILERLEADPATELVVLVGEIGGDAEERAAAWVAAHLSKPVVAYVAGRTAPPGRRMGHAGAIVSGSTGTAAAKISALKEAGVSVGDNPSDVARIVASLMNR